MLSLYLLDYHGFWTGLGLAIKYGIILLIVAIGIALIVYTKPIFYFTTWWLFFVFTPQFVLIEVDKRTHNICMEVERVIPCNTSWAIIWLTIAMFEIVFFWIPILAFAIRRHTLRMGADK